MAMTRRAIIALSDAELLTKICEESSEVIKAACKHQNHGPTPLAGGVQYDNVADVNTEAGQLNDLLFEYRMRFGTRGHKGLQHASQ